MTSEEYVETAHRAGIPKGLPSQEFDKQLAVLLKVDERTARRYRLGSSAIPGPVEVALKLYALPGMSLRALA